MVERWGLGPEVDPHFDARVGRMAVSPAPGGERKASASGYIEFDGERPHEYLEGLMAALYGGSPGGSGILFRLAAWMGIHDRPLAWTQIDALRYLTTDPDCGVALPLHDFNPDRAAGGGPEALQRAIDRLHSLTGDKLKRARRIGLTVSFKFEVIAQRLQPMFEPGRLRRLLGAGEAWALEQSRHALFGGASPGWGGLGRLLAGGVGARRYDVQRLGLAGGFRPQLVRAMRELRDGAPQPPENAQAPPLDYGLPDVGGRGTIVGVVDFGCDFAHPSFRGGAGGTGSRILALWDQNSTGSEAPAATVRVNGQDLGLGYGRVFDRERIEAVLRNWQNTAPQDPMFPYRELGYDPDEHHYTRLPPGPGSGLPGAHGTAVMEIAAGGLRRPRAGQTEDAMPRGVAHEADIVFVQVRLHVQPDGRRELDLNDVVDGVAFVFHLADAEGRDCVVNLSLNTMSGPHDGDGYFERRLASLLRSGRAGAEAKGRAVVIASGNLPPTGDEMHRWQHLAGAAAVGSPFTFFWRMEPNDRTRNSVEIWYDAADAWLQVTLHAPDGTVLGPVAPGRAAELLVDGLAKGSMVGSRAMPDLDANAIAGLPGASEATLPGRHVILLAIEAEFESVANWKVVLEPVGAAGSAPPPGASIELHAWLERDDDGQSGLCREREPTSIKEIDRASTIGTLSCGRDPIVVGAYSTRTKVTGPWGLSGRGPPRRPKSEKKPDLSAPGQLLRLILSRHTADPIPVDEFSGTSMAAPFVTGTIACMYQVAPHLRLDDVRRILTGTVRPGPVNPDTQLQEPDGAQIAQETVRPGPKNPDNWDPEYGFGRLYPAEAVRRARMSVTP
jgi:subtilisin family serine protease